MVDASDKVGNVYIRYYHIKKGEISECKIVDDCRKMYIKNKGQLQ